MIDYADCLLAVYDQKSNVRSETMQVVDRTIKEKIPITLIHPDTAQITILQTPFITQKMIGKATDLQNVIMD